MWPPAVGHGKLSLGCPFAAHLVHAPFHSTVRGHQTDQNSFLCRPAHHHKQTHQDVDEIMAAARLNAHLRQHIRQFYTERWKAPRGAHLLPDAFSREWLARNGLALAADACLSILTCGLSTAPMPCRLGAR